MKKENSCILLPQLLTALLVVALAFTSCKKQSVDESIVIKDGVYEDIPFNQEIHDAYIIRENETDNEKDNEIRSIIVDKEDNVWIATASGIFRKVKNTRIWEPIILGDDRGSAYSVEVSADGTVFMGTWNGVYSYGNGKLLKHIVPKAPISKICSNGEQSYALGLQGIWLLNNTINNP